MASPVGSGCSVSTAASGLSISTTASSESMAQIELVLRELSNTADSPASGAFPQASAMASAMAPLMQLNPECRRTPLRTPLSTKARPFVSNKIAWKDWKKEPAVHNSYTAYLVCPVEVHVYNEQAQEEVYLQQDSAKTPTYNEALQEHVYLAEAQDMSATAMKKQPTEEVSTSDEISSGNEKSDGKASSSDSDPSPPPAANRKFTKKGTPRPQKSMFSEPLPVKHTFIHYNAANDLEEDTEKLPLFSRQSNRARSAPRKMIQNDFTRLPFSRVMATVHLRHDCHPCAYFHNKIDGCRQGLACKFCHLCPADELKKRKRLKIQAFKAKAEERARLEKLESENLADVETSEVSQS